MKLKTDCKVICFLREYDEEVCRMLNLMKCAQSLFHIIEGIEGWLIWSNLNWALGHILNGVVVIL